MTPLYIAVFHDDPNMITRLIGYGADPEKPNKDNLFPLLMAAHRGLFNTCLALMLSGRVDINRSARKGYNALFAAVNYGYTALAELLIVAGAKLDISLQVEKKLKITPEQMAQVTENTGLLNYINGIKIVLPLVFRVLEEFKNGTVCINTFHQEFSREEAHCYLTTVFHYEGNKFNLLVSVHDKN